MDMTAYPGTRALLGGMLGRALSLSTDEARNMPLDILVRIDPLTLRRPLRGAATFSVLRGQEGRRFASHVNRNLNELYPRLRDGAIYRGGISVDDLCEDMGIGITEIGGAAVSAPERALLHGAVENWTIYEPLAVLYLMTLAGVSVSECLPVLETQVRRSDEVTRMILDCAELGQG